MSRLKNLRISNNLKQEDLAKLLDMDRANYSKYERGIKQLGSKTIKKLCLIYNISADYLLELSDEIRPLKR